MDTMEECLGNECILGGQNNEKKLENNDTCVETF